MADCSTETAFGGAWPGGVGCARIGIVADLTPLKAAMIVPAICYAVICGFGIYARRPAAYAEH